MNGEDDIIRSDRRQEAAAAYMAEDATDRRAALAAAVALADAALDAHLMAKPVLQIAADFYKFLRARPSIQPARLVLRHGPVTQQRGFEDEAPGGA